MSIDWDVLRCGLCTQTPGDNAVITIERGRSRINVSILEIALKYRFSRRIIPKVWGKVEFGTILEKYNKQSNVHELFEYISDFICLRIMIHSNFNKCIVTWLSHDFGTILNLAIFQEENSKYSFYECTLKCSF